MHPGGGGPKYENIMVMLTLGSLFTYYMYTRSPSKEISYNEFVNDYLIKNQVKLITISEEKTTDQFKYRATITALDDKKYHFILAQVENFLYKLDLA